MANPISLRTLHQQNAIALFPTAASLAEMQAWFPAGIPNNPIQAAMPTSNRHRIIPGNAPTYTPARTNPFASTTPAGTPVVWTDNLDRTRQREEMYLIAHHGDVAPYDSQNNTRSISTATPGNAMVNNHPNPAHWTSSIKSNGRILFQSKPWHQIIRVWMGKLETDSRGGMVTEAKKVWAPLAPVQGDIWHFHSTHPGRLLRIMLFYLRQAPPNDEVYVQWLLGGRLRPNFDAIALYHASRTGVQRLVRDPVTNALVDLVPVLKEWLEFSCAHFLVEVFANYFVIAPATKESMDMLAENYRYIAARFPRRALLLANVGEFPWRE